jgi:hypothetical protein
MGVPSISVRPGSCVDALTECIRLLLKQNGGNIKAAVESLQLKDVVAKKNELKGCEKEKKRKLRAAQAARKKLKHSET